MDVTNLMAAAAGLIKQAQPRARQDRTAPMAEAAAALIKEAIDVARGGYPSRLLAGTAGRLNPLNLLNLILTRKAYHDPAGPWFDIGEENRERGKERVQEHTDVAEQLAGADPKTQARLQNTLVRLGGSDIVDDLIWRKERGGKQLPWYKQLGGRLLHNPTTGPLGKVLGLGMYPLEWPIVNLFRSSQYNPYTDVASIMAHEKPITEHELGHAIDYNRISGDYTKRKGLKGWAAGTGRRSLRDLYQPARSLPPVAILQEILANVESHKALKKALKDKPEALFEREHRRMQVLPAGIGSYAGAMVNPLVGPTAGLAGGKIFGLEVAKRMREEREKKQSSKDKKDKEDKPRKGKDMRKAAAIYSHQIPYAVGYGGGRAQPAAAEPHWSDRMPAMQGPNLQPAQPAFGSTMPALQGFDLQPMQQGRAPQPSAAPAAGADTRDFMADVSPELQKAYPSQLATWEKAKRQEAARLAAAKPAGGGAMSPGQQAVRNVYDMPPGAQAAPATGPFSQAGIPHVRDMPAYLERLRSEGAATGGGKTDRWQAAAEKNRAAGNESTARYFEDMIAKEQARGSGQAAPAYQSSIAQQAKAQGWGKYQPQPKIPQISGPTATNPLGPLSPQPSVRGGVRGGGAALALTGGRPAPGQPGGPPSMYDPSQGPAYKSPGWWRQRQTQDLAMQQDIAEVDRELATKMRGLGQSIAQSRRAGVTPGATGITPERLATSQADLAAAQRPSTGPGGWGAALGRTMPPAAPSAAPSQQIAAAKGLGVPYAPDLGGRSAPMGGRISTVQTPVPTAG